MDMREQGSWNRPARLGSERDVRPPAMPRKALRRLKAAVTVAFDACGVHVVAPVVLLAIARYEFVDARVSATSSSVLLRDRDRRS